MSTPARAVWQEWASETGVKVGVIATLAKRIAEHLEGLPQAVAKVSTRKLKVDMGVTAVAPETWRLAVHRYQEDGPEWLLRRCSLVRASAVSAKELGHPLGHRIDLCQPGTTKAPAEARASDRGVAASTPALHATGARGLKVVRLTARRLEAAGACS